MESKRIKAHYDGENSSVPKETTEMGTKKDIVGVLGICGGGTSEEGEEDQKKPRCKTAFV